MEAKRANAQKNSSTSSKPPSSDIVKPPKTPEVKGAKKRNKGGQPGHPKLERPPFSPDWVTSDPADENQFSHVPRGSNVLYMDGHVAFIRYPRAWPVGPLFFLIVAEF